jgi:hypothetical protein
VSASRRVGRVREAHALDALLFAHARRPSRVGLSRNGFGPPYGPDRPRAGALGSITISAQTTVSAGP